MKLAHGALLGTLITLAFASNAQNSVGIGVASPNKNAVLELISPNNNQGLLIPKLTTAQRTATSFTGALTTKENGLLVFDSSENKFYYWDAGVWKQMGTSSLLSGDGVTIVNNTISTIPQDLELVGSTLKITNNPSAAEIDLTPFGSNTDDQDLSYNGTTGVLSITKISGAPSTVTLSTAGAASGDLTGNYPNPTVANNAITSAKIADGTVASADITDNSITTTDILDGTIATGDIATGGVQTADILDQTIVAADIADNAVATNHILDGTIATGDIATGGVQTADILDQTIVAADIADNAVLTNHILDGTIITGDIATGGVASVDILDATIVSVDIADNTITSADILDATIALADMNANSVNSGNIVDLTIANGDISATAGISVSKLEASANNGEVLLTSGGVAQWGAAGSSALISAPGTRNLFAGVNMGGGGTDNTFYGYQAGNATMTGNFNVLIGTNAGRNAPTGSLNTIIGYRAGVAAAPLGFNGNTLIGAQAGEATLDGPNTFIGEKAGQGNSDGTHSVFIGNSAGAINTLGFQNTIVGSLATLSANNLNNATAIGYNTVVNASNKVRIGNTAVGVIEGQVPFTSASDRRLKTNIKPIASGLDLIMKMKPVSYNMKNLSDTRTNWGFIAQDIQELVGDNNAVVTVSQDLDKTLGLRYTDFVAPLVKAVQEQQDQITDLNKKLSDSEKKYEALAAELEQIRKAVGLKASGK